MASYLGAEKDETPLEAVAVALCPGYHAERLFGEILYIPVNLHMITCLGAWSEENRER